MLTDILLFLLGLCVANAGEWAMHKYLFHGLGRDKNSIWAYHWREHHRVCQENPMIDEGYAHWTWTWNTQTKELALLSLIMLSQLPLLDWAFGYVAGFYVSIGIYYVVHRQAHLNAEWGKRYLRWHYDHHLGDEPNANWCITWPLFDYLMGTRRKA